VRVLTNRTALYKHTDPNVVALVTAATPSSSTNDAQQQQQPPPPVDELYVHLVDTSNGSLGRAPLAQKISFVGRLNVVDLRRSYRASSRDSKRTRAGNQEPKPTCVMFLSLSLSLSFSLSFCISTRCWWRSSSMRSPWRTPTCAHVAPICCCSSSTDRRSIGRAVRCRCCRSMPSFLGIHCAHLCFAPVVSQTRSSTAPSARRQTSCRVPLRCRYEFFVDGLYSL
jgi:hypothetical protein